MFSRFRRDWNVKFVSNGPSGEIIYKEKNQTIRFYWEYGGTVIFIIYLPSASTWDEKYSWAVGRREEICKRVAEEIAKSWQCNNCYAEYDNEYDCYYIKSSKG